MRNRSTKTSVHPAVVGLGVLIAATAFAPATQAGEPADGDRGVLRFDRVQGARFRFEGVVGDRVDANVANWLLPAPRANPGMLEMFRLRDREPTPNLVPWAGEFVGKYLISAIQALRMTDRDDLRRHVREVVDSLMAAQADDGYLGPFPKPVRLLAHWDLWGHYHCMAALLMWHADTGDPRALRTCRRMADLICTTFLDTDRRVFDAGSPEMNMAVIHSLGGLYRITDEPQYLRMIREIEKDWERAGDYFRTGVAGVPFHRTPKPRWESLHSVQGLVELYRITGDTQYRRAFESHWRSIVRFDRRNTGGFSSGEQATGNPYAPTAIETCCTTAWMALTVDMLRLTGDPAAADELELSLLNGSIGSQHPSGRWWTYNTPMDGRREASAHTIVFQARAGTPELNCCSVNAPRGLGMLSEWAIMQDGNSVVVNYYGAGSATLERPGRPALTLTQKGDYPRTGDIRITLSLRAPHWFALQLRIPAWSAATRIHLNGEAVPDVRPGHYLRLEREWKRGDTIDIAFDMRLRYVVGDRQQTGRVSLYRGPILLAYDQRHNAFDEAEIPALDANRLETRPVATNDGDRGSSTSVMPRPWILLDVCGEDDRWMRLCDFANAGSTGTVYRSWLAARNLPPPVAVPQEPFDGQGIPAGPILFRWRGPRRASARLTEYRLVVAATPTLDEPILTIAGIKRNTHVLSEAQAARLAPATPYWWGVVARNAHGETASTPPAHQFTIDQSLTRQPAEAFVVSEEGPAGEIVVAALHGDPKPRYGRLVDAVGHAPAAGRNGSPRGAVSLTGKQSKLKYAVETFPDEDYSLSVWVRIDTLPAGHLGQIFSAWTAGGDDPLRVCIDDGKLFARIEAGAFVSTEGVPIEPGRWMHVAAVKAGPRLTLYVDGKSRAACAAPAHVFSAARTVALGANPNFTGNEYLAATFADFVLYARALRREEIARLAARAPQ